MGGVGGAAADSIPPVSGDGQHAGCLRFTDSRFEQLQKTWSQINSIDPFIVAL